MATPILPPSISLIIFGVTSGASIGVSSFIMNVLSMPENALAYFEAFAKDVIPHLKANAT